MSLGVQPVHSPNDEDAARSNIGWAGREREQPAAWATEGAYVEPGSASLGGGQWTGSTRAGAGEGTSTSAPCGPLARRQPAAAVKELSVGERARCAAVATVGSPGLRFREGALDGDTGNFDKAALQGGPRSQNESVPGLEAIQTNRGCNVGPGLAGRLFDKLAPALERGRCGTAATGLTAVPRLQDWRTRYRRAMLEGPDGPSSIEQSGRSIGAASGCDWLPGPHGLGGLLAQPFPLPWQQLVELRIGNVRDAIENIRKPALRVNAVERRCFEETEYERCSICALVRPGEHPALSTHSHAPHTSLGRVVRHTDPAIIQVACEPLPANEHIVHRLQDVGRTREHLTLLDHPSMQLFDQRFALFLSHRSSLLSRHANNVALDPEEHVDTFDRLQRDRRDWLGITFLLADFERSFLNVCQFEESSPRMGLMQSST